MGQGRARGVKKMLFSLYTPNSHIEISSKCTNYLPASSIEIGLLVKVYFYMFWCFEIQNSFYYENILLAL